MQRRCFLQLGLFGAAAALLPTRLFAASDALKLPAELQNNPLLTFDKLPDFAAIRPEHIVPAVDFLLQKSRETVEAVSRQPEISWENFYLPLQDIGAKLDYAWGIADHLNSMASSDELRKAYETAEGKLSEYGSWYGQHQGLYRAFEKLGSQPEFTRYSDAQKAAIEHALRDFKLSGVALPAAKKKQFADISRRLSELQTKFGNNVLDSVKHWEKTISNKAEVDGLPEHALAAAAESAKSKGQSGYRFTLDYAPYAAIMTYCRNRSLRAEFYRAYARRAAGGKWDNTPVINEILKLRLQKARLLGYRSYAEYALATRMAETPQQVLGFLNGLKQQSHKQLLKETDELRRYARETDGLQKLEPWDVAYYAEKQKTERYAVDKESLRPYFPLEKVLSGLFAVAQRLYGISVREKKGVPVWHPEVRFFEIYDENKRHTASFYLDLFARENKRGGAWQFGWQSRYKQADGSLKKPVSFIVCNFGKSAGDTDLLLHDEAVTLFHEFGHGLHQMLSVIDVAAVSGINGVPWDAVEFPSQMLENWMWNKEVLPLVSGHYQSGEALPAKLIDGLIAAKHYLAARTLSRQLELALTDFRLYHEYRGQAGLIDKIRREVQTGSPLPEPDWVRRTHSFSHIFNGGYAAGYYSYLWAEVLAADGYSYFEEHGVLSRQAGEHFLKNFLSLGGSRNVAQMYRHFRGRNPEIGALLKSYGIS